MALSNSVADIAPVAGSSAALGTAGVIADASHHPVLERARGNAREHLGYAGDVTPEERKFVGYVPDSVHVAWMTGTSMLRNPRFVRELEGKARKSEVLLFLCRSGQRSAAAAEAATRAQFQHAFNVIEGFEGELDDRKRRGTTGGWRFGGLPWIQD